MSEIPGYNPEKAKTLEINPATAEALTAYDDEFFIPKITDGQDVKIGRGMSDVIYVICDFSTFDEKLKAITPEKLEEFFVASGKLEQQAPDLDENTRRLLNTCWRTARVAKSMLGDVASESQRKDSFRDYSTKTKDGKNVCVKPLSKSHGQAVCSEYAIMSQHILEKLGIQSSVVVGAFGEDPTDPFANRHTFLVLEDGKYVFDPTHSAQQKDGWPPKLFTSETALTVESLKDMDTNNDNPLGQKIICTDLLTKEEKIYGSGAN